VLLSILFYNFNLLIYIFLRKLLVWLCYWRYRYYINKS